MITELSVLIPVYNFDVTALVKNILSQCSQLNCRFEICLFDDGSAEKYRLLHRPLNEFPEVRYVELRLNIGRSAIRNLLAHEAKFNWLLILDNDSALPGPDFIKRYLEQPELPEVKVGGTIYDPALPAEMYALRWRYGRAREEKKAAARAKNPYQSLTLNNILIRRDIYLKFPLETDLQNSYGHEDTKFGWDLKTAGVKIAHIDNPVVHIGLETAEVFLQKSEQAIGNLVQLYCNQQEVNNKLLKSYAFLKKTKSEKLFKTCFESVKKAVLENLISAHPSLLYFDLYRLYLFCNKMAAINKV